MFCMLGMCRRPPGESCCRRNDSKPKRKGLTGLVLEFHPYDPNNAFKMSQDGCRKIARGQCKCLARSQASDLRWTPFLHSWCSTNYVCRPRGSDGSDGVGPALAWGGKVKPPLLATSSCMTHSCHVCIIPTCSGLNVEGN